MSRDQRIDQSATSIQSWLNTNGATFLMTSHVRSALWTLLSYEGVFIKIIDWFFMFHHINLDGNGWKKKWIWIYFWKHFLTFHMKNWQKPKNLVTFRQKPCYLQKYLGFSVMKNRVVREPCTRRTACIRLGR